MKRLIGYPEVISTGSKLPVEVLPILTGGTDGLTPEQARLRLGVKSFGSSLFQVSSSDSGLSLLGLSSLGIQVFKSTNLDNLIQITELSSFLGRVPVLGSLVIDAVTDTNVIVSVSVTATNYYDMTNVSLFFEFTPALQPNNWTTFYQAPYVTGVNTYQSSKSSLVSGEAYLFRVSLKDSKNQFLSVVSDIKQVETLILSVTDNDSNFTLVSSTFNQTTVEGTDVLVNSGYVSAIENNAIAYSRPIGQQVDQTDFNKLIATASFTPKEFYIYKDNTANTDLRVPSDEMISGTEVYSLKNTILQKHTVNFSVASEVTGLFSDLGSAKNAKSFTNTTDIKDWVKSYDYPTNIYFHGSFTTNGFVYVLGGFDGTNRLNTVYRASINSDGTLGAWVAQPNLPIAVSNMSFVVTKNKVFMIGGFSGTTATANIYTATIDASGNIGTWSIYGSLATAVLSGSTVVVNSFVYLFGGRTSSDPLSYSTQVQRASINSDGTLGTWSVVGNLPVALAYSSVFRTTNKVYIVGGMTNNDITDYYFYETSILDDNGNLSLVFNDSSGSYTTRFKSTGQSCIVSGNNVFFLGGQPNSSQVFSLSVYRGTIDNNGVMTNIYPMSNLPAGVSNFVTTVTKNKLYIIGGYTLNGSSKDVYTADFDGWESRNDATVNLITLSLNPLVSSPERLFKAGQKLEAYFDASVVSFRNKKTTQDKLRSSTVSTLNPWIDDTYASFAKHSASVINTGNRVYYIGGMLDYSATTTSAEVWTAPISNAGVIGTWALSSQLPGPLANSQIIRVKNWVYLLGGTDATNIVSTVYRAPVNTDGTLGLWATYNSLSTPVYGSNVVVLKNKVYLLCNKNKITEAQRNASYVADIDNDGNIGTWTTYANPPIAPLTDSQVVVTKSKLYLISSGLRSDVVSAPINADGSLGSWISETPFPITLEKSHSLVTKNRVWLFGGNNGSSQIAQCITAPIDSNGTIGTWSYLLLGYLPDGVESGSMIVTRNFVYFIGGYGTNAGPSYDGQTPGVMDFYLRMPFLGWDGRFGTSDIEDRLTVLNTESATYSNGNITLVSSPLNKTAREVSVGLGGMFKGEVLRQLKADLWHD